MKRLSAAAVLAVHFAAFAEFTGVTNYWVGSDWGLYDTATNWRVNDKSAGENAVPTANDMIFADANQTYKINLGGTSHTVAQIGSIAGTYVGQWSNEFTLHLTNGTLNISSWIGRRVNMTVWNGATVVFEPGISVYYRYGMGGAATYDIKRGGQIDINNLRLFGFKLTIDSGAVANFCDGLIVSYPTLNDSNYSEFHIYGDLNAPNGILFKEQWGVTAKEILPYTKYILYAGGKLTLGGPMKRNASDDANNVKMSCLFKGGTLKSTGTVTFDRLKAVEIEPNAAMEFEVADGASLRITNATYGAGSVITKTGTGNFILGYYPIASLVQNAGTVTLPADGVFPDSFTMNAGTLSIGRRGTTFPGVTFSEGCTLNFNEVETRIDSPSSYSGINVTVGSGALVRGATILYSSDATFLSLVKSQLDSALPEGWSARLDDGRITLLSVTGNTFNATLSGDLSDTTAWAGGSVPTGEDVVISGAGTVNFNASSPSFSKITVEGGATLSVAGGTLEAPVALPPMELRYDSRLLINGEAVAQSTNGLDCIANAISLPVLEIATNSTFILQTPNLPQTEVSPFRSAYNDYGFRIKNVNLKWYGQLRMPTERTTEAVQYMMSQARIGWAEKNETSYLALDCQGGTLYRKDTYSGDINANHSPLTIAYPKRGGTVVPVGTLLLRDYRKEGDGDAVGNGTIIGFNNPESVRIPIVFDGNTVVKCDAYNRLAGGADLTIKGPAKWYYEYDFYGDPGWTRDLRISESATLTLVDGGLASITPSYSTYSHDTYGFHNLGTNENVVSLAARDSYIGYWEWRGEGRTSARIEDSYIMVGQRYRYGSATSGVYSIVTQTPLFNNFKSVEVPSGKTMWVLATNIWNGGNWDYFGTLHDWDRVTKFGPPITGGGNVAVSNALLNVRVYYNTRNQSEYSMTAIITNGANTATGLAYADPPSPVGARSYLLFGDGANWAGTVVANGWLGLTNLTAESAAPVSVTFGSMLFETNFPIRLWKDGDVLTNDVINLTSGVSGDWGLEAEYMDGYAPQVGDTFTLGTYPAEAALPKFTGNKNWKLERNEIEGVPMLQLKYRLRGCVFTIK